MDDPTVQKNIATVAVDAEPRFDMHWSPGLDPDDLRALQAAEQDPSKIVVKLPKESARMGYFSTVCLLFNRMIGRTSDSQTKDSHSD